MRGRVEFDPDNAYPSHPAEWSAEAQGTSYPIDPGQSLRVFYEFQVQAVDGVNTDAMHDITLWGRFLNRGAEEPPDCHLGFAGDVSYETKELGAPIAVPRAVGSNNPRDVLEVGKLIASTQVMCTAGGYALYAPLGFTVAKGFTQVSSRGAEDASNADPASAVQAIRSLQVKTYPHHDGAESGEYFGLIADSRSSLFHGDSPESVDLSSVVAALVAVVQEQSKMIENLKT